jgi:adenylyltransferase/sulfurtransferase
VLGVLPGTIGAIQATEAIKYILGIGESLVGRLMLYDALTMNVDYVKLRKNPDCPICGENPTITELIDYEEFCGMPAHDHSEFSTTEAEGHDAEVRQMSPQVLKERLDGGDDLVILDVREQHEWDISNLETLGAVLIPKGDVVSRMGELDTSREMVVQCRSGARSADIVRELQQHGFKKLWNLDGGINRWAKEIDTSLPTY